MKSIGDSLARDQRRPLGITDWFRRRDTSIEPEALLRTLVDASERKDYPELMRLINTHRAVIRERFRSWMTVPEDVRGDREAVQRYFNTLLMLATVFENAGDRTLKNWLMRQGEDNPVGGWQRDLERGQALIDEGRPGEAIPLLRSILDSMCGAIGTWIDDYRPRVLRHLGIALAKSGNRAEAISVMREARELCRNIGDEEGRAELHGESGCARHLRDPLGRTSPRGPPALGRVSPHQ
jgi:hypothetical protein